jgi:hypothetical protein
MTRVTGSCFHARMAKHEAGDSAGAHPLVEAALRRRTQVTHGAHRARLPGQEGAIGWPGPDRDTARIGWPGDLQGGADSDHADSDAGSDDEPAADPEPPVSEPPRARRRWFGRQRAA